MCMNMTKNSLKFYFFCEPVFVLILSPFIVRGRKNTKITYCHNGCGTARIARTTLLYHIGMISDHVVAKKINKVLHINIFGENTIFGGLLH